MRPWTKLVAGATILAAGVAVAAPAMTVKDIMNRLNKGPGALTTVLKKELQNGTPAWPDIQKQTKEYVELVSVLGQSEPPKGESTSWTRMTGQYASVAKELDAAAEHQDRSAALAAHGKLVKTCNACHKAHRP